MSLRLSLISSSDYSGPTPANDMAPQTITDSGNWKHRATVKVFFSIAQPVPPCMSLRESVQVYKEHCRMAREFHQVKHDIAVLEERKRKLLAEMVEDEKVTAEIARLEEEFRRLTEENRTLMSVHNERAQQLETLCLTSPRTTQDNSS
ncbi:MAP3K7 C-terminal-like protein isoform X1 [Cheilinus undulatus]|uniref:MAP3K7 C-terminal-like protein isoform X1 n=1 Tax=Cheilinus undulatus TaxID=241271 RepID=UPI001BD28452|nr:MAP3K7 C-terminal-like protein isoform X1 [Cheilinus undulatus]